MAARSTIEERLASVEARMSALDHLPAQVNRLESQMRDMHGELLARVDDARRETRGARRACFRRTSSDGLP
jgi:hypothetical protein